MPKKKPDPVFDALRAAAARGVMPTTLDTAGLRELGAEVLGQAVFCAHGASVIFVSKIKEVVDALAAGEMDFATARWTLMETIKATGYTPEGGFPDTPPGLVPPALAGTLQDLSSLRRIEFILRTQLALIRGKGQQMRGSTAEAIEAYPAWELVRVYQVRVPRDWPRRWVIAGGKPGPMIALKGDPIWGELGSYGNFDDALGVDHPPFAFNSGMGWRAVAAGEVRRLRLRGPDDETPEEFAASRPVTLDGKLPPPFVDVNRVDPALLKKLEERDGVVVEDGKAMRPEDKERILAKLDEQEAASAARRAARLQKAIAARKEEYGNR